MAYYRVCKNCKCSLDPGEGTICEECKIKEERQDQRLELITTGDNGQMKLGGLQGMRTSKIRIKNLFGIKEFETNGISLELGGKNGTGKTSILDAIKLALTNKSDRDYIVRKGETEGEIIVETDTGLRIDRKIRTTQADYKSVKNNGAEVGSPETFLRDIFTPLQLNPVEFMSMDKKKQNAIILDMIVYDWDLNKIREWFGEIPEGVSYDQNILQVLNDIQSESGDYFKRRTDISRDIRNNKAFVEEIAEAIPAGYDVVKWEKKNLSSIYTEIETIRKKNEEIEKRKNLLENRNNKVRSFEATKEIALAALDKEYNNKDIQLDKDIESLRVRIREMKTEKTGLSEKKSDKKAVIEEKYKADIAKYDAEVEQYKDCANKEKKDFTELSETAAETEKMKSYINEYRRMIGLQEKIDTLMVSANELTRKIELARSLPGTILENAVIPIEGLTVKDGIPLINELPVSNLSEGEKLDLCIDVALQKPNGLQIILIDGVEKLATDMRHNLYAKCKEKGLQFIATRTTDDDAMTVMEL